MQEGYYDFSHVTIESMAPDSRATGLPSTGLPSGRSRNFPAQLHYVLSELEADGLDDLCGYQPHGRCFVVRKQKEFVEQVLCRWFHQTKIASFQRQLNIYGFTRITSGPDKDAYYHPLFLRGKLFLAEAIPRQDVKGQGPRRSMSRQSVPNIYNMLFLPVDDRRRSARENQSSKDQSRINAGPLLGITAAHSNGQSSQGQSVAGHPLARSMPSSGSHGRFEANEGHFSAGSMVEHTFPGLSLVGESATFPTSSLAHMPPSLALGNLGSRSLAGIVLAEPLVHGRVSSSAVVDYLVQRDLDLVVRRQAARDMAWMLQYQRNQTLASLVALQGLNL